MTTEEWQEFLDNVSIAIEGETHGAAMAILPMLERLKGCSVVEWHRATRDADIPMDEMDEINDFISYCPVLDVVQASNLGSINKGDLFASMPYPPEARRG